MMTEYSDEVFLLNEESLQPLPNRPMRAGLFGAQLESALQTLLQKYPEVIPGRQIDPMTDSPPQFVLLRREMPVGGWSLDHLFVDQYGTLTLVEAKLIQNPQSRREVIGQIIEYAANASELWAAGRAREYAREYWSRAGHHLEDVLLSQFGEDLDIEEFWETVEANLAQGKFRLLIAADELRPEVRRMIEYLNAEMRNAEILGLELACYGHDDSQLVLVPRIVGQSDVIQRAKKQQSTVPHTDGESFLATLTPEIRNFFEKVFRRVEAHERFELYWGTKGFSLRVSAPSGKRISVFYGYPPGAHGRSAAFVWGSAQQIPDETYKQVVRNRFLELPGFYNYGKDAAELLLNGDSSALSSAERAVDIAFEVGEDLLRKSELLTGKSN